MKLLKDSIDSTDQIGELEGLAGLIDRWPLNTPFAYTWRVSDFAALTTPFNQFVSSPPFDDPSRTTRWTVQLYPKGHRVPGYLSIYLRLENSDVTPRRVNASISLLNSRGQRFNSFHLFDLFQTQKPEFGWKKFFKRNTLLTQTVADMLLPRGQLTIQVEMEILNDEEENGPMNGSELKKVEYSDSSLSRAITSAIRTTSFEHTWHIDNFTSIPSSSKISIESACFHDPSGATGWCLELDSEGSQISVNLRLLRDKIRGKIPLRVRPTFWFLDSDGTTRWFEWSFMRGYSRLNDCFGIPYFVARETLLEEADRLLPAGRLTVHVRVEILGGEGEKRRNDSVALVISENESKVSVTSNEKNEEVSMEPVLSHSDSDDFDHLDELDHPSSQSMEF